MAKVAFGNKQAGVLCNLSPAARVDLLAEGLPIILASSEGFWSAAKSLAQAPREAQVLEGFAEEEAAKILILIDLVRCPPKRASAIVGRLVRTYYDHLGRLIYAEAQSWKPVNVKQLREYVDHTRKAHYLEGFAGEYILPNWNRYSRESAMYADIECYEDGLPTWNQPQVIERCIPSTEPLALLLARAMDAAGMFSRAGLQAIADIWGTLEFTHHENSEDNREMVQKLFVCLDAEKLVSQAATADHVRLLRGHWQMPMYDLEFREVAVPLEELEAERDAQRWADLGGPSDYV